MTTEEKIAIVLASYAAFNAGPDLDALLQLYDPECEWIVASEGAAFGNDRFLGHDGLRQFVSVLREAMAVLSEWRVVVDELRSTPSGRLLVRGHTTAKWVAVEAPTEAMERPIWQHVEFRGDRIRRVVQHDDQPSGWNGAARLASH